MKGAWKKELARLTASIKSDKEADELLGVLLTPAEHEELAKRWQIVKELIEGVPQRTVRDKLSVSIATVTRGSRELQYGNGIFQKFYKRSRGR
jgi:Trp operon repressor